MTPSDLSSVFGLIGTVLLSIAPIRVEWFRFRTRKLSSARPKNPQLENLVRKAIEARESIIVAQWTILDSINVLVGFLFLMLSYVIQLV